MRFSIYYLYLILIVFITIYFIIISRDTQQFYDYLFNLIDILPLPKLLKNIILLPQLNLKSKNKLVTQHKPNRSNKPKRSNRQVTSLTKKIVASNQKWKCRYCGQLLDFTYEIDHIVPLFKGGGNEITNLQALCRNCHAKKTLLFDNNQL